MRPTIALVVTVVFPGTGHLLLRRYLKGSVLAALFAASTDVFLITTFLWPGEGKGGLILVSLAIMIGVWGYALLDVVSRLKVLRQEDFQERKDELLKAAQVAWLKDENAEAERLLKEIIALDDRDVEAWVHLGKVLKSVGREEEARMSFRTALHLEGSKRWHWELKRELGLVEIKVPETESS
ncbi:MAG: hypothetical protein AMS16_03745 [Planctomycetes bacterium DG_58]|nr:MAG: hypothetical protein AMS16_03745 [Planctomycetes bacterium DG_58]